MGKLIKTSTDKKPKTVISAPVIKTVKRKIHFYELHIDFVKSFTPKENPDQFLGFFSIITKLAKTKDSLRYQPVFEAQVFMQDLKFIDAKKQIRGKLRYVKKDVFPELIDTTTDETNDIETTEDQGIVETTHFIIDYSKPTKKIAIEYNHAGAKIADFITYFQLIGAKIEALTNVNYITIVKDELVKLKDRVGLYSTVDIKIHKDNIPQIEALDNKLYSTIKAIKDQYNTEYIELKFRFKYRKINGVTLAGFIMAALTILITVKSSLKAKGYDDAANAMIFLFSTKHYTYIVQVFIKAIIELFIVFILLYITWLLSNNLADSCLFKILIILTIEIFIALFRVLFTLFNVLSLENLEKPV